MPSVPLSSRKALIVKGALASFLRPRLLPGVTLALDGALGGVNRLNWKTEKEKVLATVIDLATPKLAKDAKLDDLRLAMDRMDDEDDGEAEDDDIGEDDDLTEAEKEAKAKAEEAAKDKRAKDAKRAKDRAARDAKAAKDKAKDEKDDDDDDKDEDDKAKDSEIMSKAAMDAAFAEQETRIIDRMNAAIEAREAVRPLVGQVSLALDSAAAIYKFALDAYKIPVKDVHPSAYKVMVGMIQKPGQTKPQMAQDAQPSAALHTRFPSIARFGHV